MSEFTWFSRLAVLAGVFVLVVESVTARAVGVFTLVAVLAVFLGFLALVVGLVLDERLVAISDPIDGVPNGVVQASDVPVSDVETTPVLPVPEVVPQIPREEIPIPRAPGGQVYSIRVDDELSGHLTPCPACVVPFRVGQIAARCNVCGAMHHASCWIDSGFACAIEGCTGGGSLLAPGETPAGQKVNTAMDVPRGGPSKP